MNWVSGVLVQWKFYDLTMLGFNSVSKLKIGYISGCSLDHNLKGRGEFLK